MADRPDLILPSLRPVAVNLTPSERKTVDLLTNRRVLHFSLERNTQGARVLVLAPKVG